MPEVIIPSEAVNPNDEVDDFVAQRHKVMLEKVQTENDDSDDLGDEPEIRERDVLNIDMSDSDEEEDQSGSSDDDDDGRNELEERKGWGGKKNLWYGGDTHEYEIMEDEEREEALKDEEEEALRLQKEALENMRPEDYRDDEEDTTEAGEGEGDERNDDELDVLAGIDVLAGSNFTNSEVVGSVLSETAPEVPILIKEMLECRKQAKIWKERVHWNEVARILYHLYASFVNNVAFYLSLRTDPDSVGVDIRTHPVLVQIVRIRSLIKDARALPCEEPVAPLRKESQDAADGSNKPKAAEVQVNANGKDVNCPVANGGIKDLEKKKKTRKKRKKSSKENSGVIDTVEDDEEKIRALLLPKTQDDDDDAEEHRHEQKRRKLNALVGAMERERKNSDGKRLASADADVVRAEPKAKKSEGFVPQDDHDGPELVVEGMDDDDDEVMQKMLAKKAKKEARKARKAAEAKPHVYAFKDEVNPEARRRASSQVVKNRGLTRYRPKDKKTPRTKNRLAYSKAVVRRKGAVQDYVGKSGASYSGEASGINMSARKGSRLSNV